MSVVIDGSAGVTTNSGAVYNGISAGTAVASTSGTSIDFTSIPSWVKRITVMFNGVSTNGTSPYQIQLGTSGGVVTTGYVSSGVIIYGSVSSTSSTTGLLIAYNAFAGYTYSGHALITLISNNTWVSSALLSDVASTPHMTSGGGTVSLSGTLDRIRITTVNGTDTFDAGSINILYE